MEEEIELEQDLIWMCLICQKRVGMGLSFCKVHWAEYKGRTKELPWLRFLLNESQTRRRRQKKDVALLTSFDAIEDMEWTRHEME